MAIKGHSALLADAELIRTASLTGENTADRVGAMLVALLKGATLPYDSSTAYEANQYVIFNGIVCRAISATTAGQTPVTHPLKWDKFIVDADQLALIKADGPLLPVSARALYQYVKGLVSSSTEVPVSDFTTLGKVRRLAADEIAKWVNVDTVPENEDQNGYVAPPELFAAIRSLISASESNPGLSTILENDNQAPDQEATLKALRLSQYTLVEKPKVYVVFEPQPDGTYCLMGTEEAGGGETIDPPTVPTGIENQTYYVNKTFTWQFPAFPGAKRYDISIPPTGFTRDEVNRVIGGIGTKLGETLVKITGINEGGEVSVDVLFTGLAEPVSQQVTEIYWADNGGTSLSLYAFGSAEPQQMLYSILNPTDDSVVISERPFLYSPGKYDKPGLFVGYAPYTALVLGLTTGTNYKIKARVEGSSNYAEEVFTYASGQKGKVYPLVTDILAFKTVVASSNNSDAPKANDTNSGTFYISTATAEQAIQFDAGSNFQFSSIPLNVGDGTVNFWIVGYAGSVTPPAIGASLYTAINAPGIVFMKSYAGPFSGGLYTVDEDDGLVGKVFRHLRIQKADSSVLKIQVEGHGTPVANTPPNVVTPIPNVVLTEGDSLTKDVRPNFADANLDLLTYSAKRRGDNGVFDQDLYDWLVFLSGVFTVTAAEFEGSTGTARVDAIRVFASDGQAQIYSDYTLTVNKKNVVPAGVVRAAVQFDRNNSSMTPLLQLDSGVPTVEMIGVSAAYPQGLPAKGMSSGSYTFDSKTYNWLGTSFPSGVVGQTYKARFNVPNGVLEASFPIPTGTGNPVIVLYPVGGEPTTGSVTNVYLDEARLASEKKVTARSEASEQNQFQLKTATDGTIIFNFTDGAIPSGKAYYELINNTVLTPGTGYVLTSRLKSAPLVLKTYAFTVPDVVAPQIVKIGITPNSIVDGICRSVNIYAQVTTGTVIQEAWYRSPDDFYTMSSGTFPQDYNRTANMGGAPNTGIEFETSRLFQFKIQGSSEVISVTYARNGDAIGTIRQVYPAYSADTPTQNYNILAEPTTVDYKVRHAGGKAYWRLVINRSSGYHVVQWDSAGNKYIDDTTEHEVEIGEDIQLIGFHTKSTTGDDLNLQNNGDPTYGNWISRRTLTKIRTSTERA